MPGFIVECTYCGIGANCLDHVIPVSYKQIGRKGADYSKELVVPSCDECNNKLSNFYLPSIAERAEYLIGAYNKKYKKILSAPDWTEEEIRELGPTLRKTIQGTQNLKEVVLCRLIHLADVATQVNLEPFDVWDKYSDDIFGRFRGYRNYPKDKENENEENDKDDEGRLLKE